MPTQSGRPKSAHVANLLQRKLGWYVRYQVPRALQPIYGKREVVRTLGTTDKREAQTRLHAAYAQIQREVEQAVRHATPTDYSSSKAVAAELEAIAQAVRRGEFPEPDDPAEVGLADLYVEEALEAHARALGSRDPQTGRPASLTTDVVEAASLATQAIHNPKYRPLHEWIEAHLASASGAGLKPSTLKKRRRFVEEFGNWCGRMKDPRAVTVALAVEYSDHLRNCEGSPRVKKDALTNLHTFFEWLRNNRRLIDANPFHGLSAQIEGKRSGSARRPWTKAELLTILNGLNPASRLWTAVAIALYSGMRVDEISSMEVAHVDDASFRIVQGKNLNSERHVPIHPVIAPMVARLVATSYDGRLISGITPTGYDAKHGVYVSKRFSIQKPNLGLTDPAATFHSFRHNFTSAAENAEIPETTVALLVGHKRQNMTFGRYSEGREWEGLVSAMAKISHKPEVDETVAELVRHHEGNTPWRHRLVRELI